MIEILITDLRTGQVPYSSKFPDLEDAKPWILYMLPGLSDQVDQISPNTRISVDGVYELTVKTDQKLPIATPATASTVGSKPTTREIELAKSLESQSPPAVPPAAPAAPPAVNSNSSPATIDLSSLDAHEAIALVNKQTDPEVLTQMADAERAGKKRRTVLNVIAEQIEEIQTEPE